MDECSLACPNRLDAASKASLYDGDVCSFFFKSCHVFQELNGFEGIFTLTVARLRLPRTQCPSIFILVCDDAWASDTLILGNAIVYALVARETVILAEYAAGTGNFASVTRKILEKIPGTDSRMSYVCDRHIFHIMLYDGLTYMCMAEEDFGRWDLLRRNCWAQKCWRVMAHCIKKLGKAGMCSTCWVLDNIFMYR